MTNGPSVSGTFILRGQAIGFSLLVAIMWLVELLRLPHHFFGESPQFIWSRVLLRTVTVLIIWVVVHLTTRRLLRRLHELEEFLRMCSWCRRIGHRDEWLSFEEFFSSKYATETTHGICPECAKQQLAGHRASRVNPPPAA